MRTPSVHGVGLGLVGLAMVALAACGTQAGADPFAVAVDKADKSIWTNTGLPFGGYTDDGNTLQLAYRDHVVSLPATDPAWTKAAELKPGDETPRLELSTAGATAHSGIFQLTPPGKESQLWELTQGGEWRQIGSAMTKIALADIQGAIVVWIEGATESAGVRTGTKVVAYDTDTDSEKVIGELDAAETAADSLWVMAVNGGSVMLHGVGSAQDEDSTRNYIWNPRKGILTAVPDDQPGSTVTDYHEESGALVILSHNDASYVRTVNTDLEIGDFGFAQFNSDASQVLAQGYGLARLLDTKTGEPIKLEVPIDDQDKFIPGSFAWTSDDRLAVIGARADQQQAAYLCTPSTGVCDDIGTDYLWSSSRENSARGQLLYHDEQEGD